MQKSYPVKISS